MTRSLYVPVTLTIAGAQCGLGIAQRDLDLIGSGLILAVLALVVARLPGSGRRDRFFSRPSTCEGRAD